eukprot:9612099-Alexandrium_andersonii.AAC.1
MINLTDHSAAARVELHDQAGGLGSAQDGCARPPETNQGAGQHGDVIDKGRRRSTAGRERCNNDW